MEKEDYNGAARVYMYARKIRHRTEPLPLYSPYVIRRCMYSNIDYNARKAMLEEKMIT